MSMPVPEYSSSEFMRFSALLIGFVLAFTSRIAVSQPYFAVPAVASPAPFISNLSHTAHLLSSGTPDRPTAIRVLVYGQSISMQDWWKEVKSFLTLRYPYTQITMENKAIGGFSTERLKRMVANDVVPFAPDLILFHDYGKETDYEQIIRMIRSRTTAEIAVQTDHVGVGQNQTWHDQHSNVWLPALCRKYNLALLDVRSAWKQYLHQNSLSPTALLTDNVHLNAHGNYLMAGIINRYIESLPAVPKPAGMVKVKKAGRDFKVKKDRITLPVEGSRVDLVWKQPITRKTPVAVRINRQRPSDVLACYYYTRPTQDSTQFFLTHIGQLLAMQLGGQPQEEDWTLTVTAVDSVQQIIRFAIRGSRTGEDGTGSSDAPFTSRSGRMSMAPTDWFLRKSPDDFKQFRWLAPGDTLHWQVKWMCRDEVLPSSAATVTIAQGLKNTAHVLELTGKTLSQLREIQVYQPPLPE